MKKNYVPYIVIAALVAVIAAGGLVIIDQHSQIQSLKRSMVSLAVGEQIDYFDLIAADQLRIDASALNSGKVSLIFVFKHPCVPCNHNLTLWRRMDKILNGKVEIYGIWLGNPTEMFNFQEKTRLGFNLYAPVDTEKFKKELRLNLNYAQTILYYDNRVAVVKIQDLAGDDYTAILRKIKKCLKIDLKTKEDKDV
jgi:peroxiredoxin